MGLTLTTKFNPRDDAWIVRRDDAEWYVEGPVRVEGVSVIATHAKRREVIFIGSYTVAIELDDAYLTEESALAEALLRNDKEGF